MKRRIIFSLISLILAVAMVITALSSCSADNSSLILCNVKLEEDEYSRRLTSTVTSNTISASAIYYHPEYLGTGSSYSEINSDKTSITDDVTGEKYILYNDGILLSQGLWNIKCIWKDEEGSTVLEGETGPTWINLNTEKLYVRFGECSLSLTYSVTCKETINPYIVLNMYSYENGNISSSALSEYENKTLSKVSSTTVSTESTSSGTVNTLKHSFSYDFSSFNQAGSFVIVLQIKDTNKNDVLFTDVIGFVSRLGNTTALKGSCEITDSNVGGSSVYLPEISDPTDPIRGSTGEIVEVTNSPTSTTDGTIQKELNKVTIEDNKVYFVIADQTTGSANSMTLDHSNGNSSSRIISPINADFGINLNGTDVVLTSATNTGDYITESSAIIELNTGSSLTLYNNRSTGGRDATWALMAGTRRYEANTMLKGGNLYIVGNNVSDNISNAGIVFKGPVFEDNENSVIGDITEAGSGKFVKQGAINIYSNSTSTGGNIVLDGNVTVKAVTGISTWETAQLGWLGIYTIDSTIDAPLTTNISLLHGARIFAEGDNHSDVLQDTATGIYILGNRKGGTINIVLDKGSISTSGSSGTEAGIRIEKFTGTINIELKNGSTINSTNGYGIYLVDCTGDVTIKKDGSSTISGKNTSSTIYTSNVPKLSKNF